MPPGQPCPLHCLLMTRPWRLEGSTLGLRAGSPKSLELSVARYLPGPGLSLCLPGGVTLSELCLFSRLGEQADQGQHTGWGSMGQSAVWLLTFLVTLSLGLQVSVPSPKGEGGQGHRAPTTSYFRAGRRPHNGHPRVGRGPTPKLPKVAPFAASHTF